MECGKEEIITSSHLKFIGRILSIFTHELNNHLAIMKESAGLATDILSSTKPPDKDLQTIFKVVLSIESQIGKTSWLGRQLNSFGHRMDNPLSAFSVNESIGELLALVNKDAAQKTISLEKDFQDNIPLIYNSPSKFQFLIFCFIDHALRKLDKNSRIIFRTKYIDNSIAVSIILVGNHISTKEETWTDEIYSYIINQLGGSISQNGDALTITLPVSRTHSSDASDKTV